MDKSHMFVVGVHDQVKAQLLEKTGFAQGTFPIRYLGLPLSSKKWSKLETTVDQQDYKPDNNYLCKTIIICWKATSTQYCHVFYTQLLGFSLHPATEYPKKS